MLEWAPDHPKTWHQIGQLDATKKPAELLAKRGVIEIWPETKMYRLKPDFWGSRRLLIDALVAYSFLGLIPLLRDDLTCQSIRIQLSDVEAVWPNK